MTRRLIQRDKLGVLIKTGQDAHGVVYGAPNVKTKFAASMVFKEYDAQTLAEIDFTALAAMAALIDESLSNAETERLISFAAWPCALVEDCGTTTGFVMPAIPEEFFTDLTTVKGVSRTTAEVQHLVKHASVVAAGGIAIDDVQRYSLLREVASALAFLHKHGVCVGDISPRNLLFSLTPHEAIYFIDCDAMCIDAVSAVPQMETTGWDSPPGEELATVYTDTYKLGLLALRLLAGDHDTKNPHHIPATAPESLRQIITDTLTNPPQQRPLSEVWTSVLGYAIEHAQHHKKTPAPTTARASAPPALLPTPIVHSRPPSGPSAPPLSEPGPPRKPPTASRTKIWFAAAAFVALVVFAVALANHMSRAPSSAPQTSSTRPSSYPSHSTTVAPSPGLSAGVPGLAPFAREWRGMRESIMIDPTGHGHFHYMMACASCSMADMPYNTLDFALTSVFIGTASGSITASSDPRFPVGEPVAAPLAPQDTIRWAVGDKDVGLFCGSNPAWCGG